MKRKLLFLVSLLTTSMLLSACDLGGNNDNGDGGDGSGGSGANFNGDQNEAINKLYQLGSTQGFELTIKTLEDDGEEDEETFGFKSDIFWIKEDAAYQNVANGIDYYDYDSETQLYDFEVTLPPAAYASLSELVKQFTSEFYIGYQMLSNPALAGSISAETATTFLGRGAKEYTYSYSVGGQQANFKIIFDNETGITLKVLATASAADGGQSFAQYEITSFKTGDQVVPPRLSKSGGQGGEGEGGEGEGEDIGDVFSNKLLMYISNENANLYANSQLALFADGKFEFKFLQAGYQVVIFGNYTVSSSDKSLAALTTTSVYKDQGKQTSPMNESWTLSYSSGAYALKVSANGTVNFIAAGGEPSHYVIPGQGEGEGGETEGAKFVNRAFIYVSQQNAPDFVDSKIGLFDDNTFEVVTYVNGKMLVYLGAYTVNASDTEASLTVARQYSEASNSYSDAIGNWKLGIQKNGVYHLAMLAATVVYNVSSAAPIRQDLPIDQGGQGGQSEEDAKFQITATFWEEMIVGVGFISMNSNFTAMVRSSDMNGQNKYEFDGGLVHALSADGGDEYYKEFTSDNGGNRYTKNESGVWVSNSFNYEGISGFITSLFPLFDVTKVAFDELEFNSQTKEYELSSWSYNGGSTFTNITFSFENNKLMKASYILDRIYHEVELAKYGSTSVTLPEVGSGGQGEGGEGGQTESKWPAETIAQMLERLELNVELPALSNETNVASVNPAIPADNSCLLITVTYSDAIFALSEMYAYIGENQAFSMDVARSDITNEDQYARTFVYLNETNDVMVSLSVNKTNKTLIILVSKFNASAYPTQDIIKFFEDNELENVLPSLEMDNVSYSFAYEMLIMTPTNGNTNENIISGAGSKLLNAGFKVMYMLNEEEQLVPFYVQPSLEYYVGFMEYEGSVWAMIVVEGLEDSSISCPQEIIAATVPEDCKDTLPSFNVGDGLYDFYRGDYGYELVIHVQPNSSMERALGTITRNMSRGYTLDEETGAYVSQNGDITISIENIQDCVIYIIINYASEEPIEEPEMVEYTFICDNNWDITASGAQLYLYVFDGEGNYEWIAIEYEEGQKNFKVELSKDWVGCQVVRFSDTSEIGWPSEDNPDVKIWNRTDKDKDIRLNGEGGEVHFTLLG